MTLTPSEEKCPHCGEPMMYYYDIGGVFAWHKACPAKVEEALKKHNV